MRIIKNALNQKTPGWWHSPLLMALTAAAFWLVVYLISYFDWGRGTGRALMLSVVFVCTPLLLWLRRGRLEPVGGAVKIFLAVACAGALAWHVFAFAEQLPDPHLLDIATTTVAAGKTILKGQNPYTVPLDVHPHILPGQLICNGFKYLPMMAVVYAPLGSVWGERGVLVTNLILDLAVAGLVFLIAARNAGQGAGLLAAFLFLMLPLVPFEIFHQGSTDLAAVAPILGALLIMEKRPGLAGFLVGLSVSTKLLPGAVLVLCCLPGAGRRRYMVGLFMGLLPSLGFLALSPVDLIANTVLFSCRRAADSTSWLYGLPDLAGGARVVFTGLMLGAGAWIWFRRPAILDRCGLCVMCMLGALLSGPVSHRNYQLWWLPLFAILLASVVAGRKWGHLSGSKLIQQAG